MPLSRLIGLSLLASCALTIANGARAQLLVSENVFPSMWLHGFDETDGSQLFLWPIDSLGNQTQGLLFGPDNGYLYATAGGTNEVLFFDVDFTAGNVNDAVRWAGAFQPSDDMVFPTDMVWVVVNSKPMIYVASPNSNKIVRYDPTTGLFIDVFVTGLEGSLFVPYGLALNDQNELYIASSSNIATNIFKVDAATGAALDNPSDGDSVFFSLSGRQPRDVAIGPNGNLYISATDTTGNSGTLYQVNPQNGVPADGVLINSRDGGQLKHPKGLAFGADGKLYVANRTDNKVLVYNATTLNFESEFANGVAGSDFNFLTFVSKGCSDGVDNDLDGLTDFPSDTGCFSATDSGERDIFNPCDNGFDDDQDGLVDFPLDPGCLSATDASEREATLPCDDGVDNDGDGRTDFDPVTLANPGDAASPPGGSGDPGCKNPWWVAENPQCQNGTNDDGQAGTDYDGGAFLNGGVPIDAPDPQCLNKPWRNLEKKSGCGNSILPVEGVPGPTLAALLLMVALCKRDPRRGSRSNH